MYKITIKHDEDLQAKQLEIQTKVDAYMAAQAHQLAHGGPGPVADYEIMAIVNEHAGQFEIIQEAAPVIEEPAVEPVVTEEPVA